MPDLEDRWRELGEYIRDQRSGERLSLRRLSDLAGISNPYLSQIERGLRKPSAEILQHIAKALSIPAEMLYIRAGILEERDEDDLLTAIYRNPRLTGEQKQALARVYESFRRENGRGPVSAPSAVPDDPDGIDGEEDAEADSA